MCRSGGQDRCRQCPVRGCALEDTLGKLIKVIKMIMIYTFLHWKEVRPEVARKESSATGLWRYYTMPGWVAGVKKS